MMSMDLDEEEEDGYVPSNTQQRYACQQYYDKENDCWIYTNFKPIPNTIGAIRFKDPTWTSLQVHDGKDL